MGYVKQPVAPKPVLKSGSGTSITKDDQNVPTNNNDSHTKNMNEKKVKFVGISDNETPKKGNELSMTSNMKVYELRSFFVFIRTE